MIGTPLRFEVLIDESTSQELEKALRFFYGDVVVDRDGTEGGPVAGFTISGAPVAKHDDLQRVAHHFLQGFRATPHAVIVDRSSRRDPSFGEPELLDDDRIEVDGGVYLQGPRWVVDMDATRAAIRTHFADEFQAPHLVGPAFIPRSVLTRAGYYRKFPNLVHAVSRIRENYWDGVAVSRLEEAQVEALSTFYVPSDVVLTPVTCYHVYAQAEQLLRRHGTTMFTIDGPVFRHESHNHDATRLAEFSMFELVKMGSNADVTAEHEQFLLSFQRFFDALELPYRIVTAADAFYGDQPVFTRAAQMLSGGKYEVRVPLGDRELSVGSVNFHGSVFADAFDLDGLGGIEATCCAGIGIDRLVYALRWHGSPVVGSEPIEMPRLASGRR